MEIINANINLRSLSILLIAAVATISLYGIFREIRQALKPQDVYEAEHQEVMAKNALALKRLEYRQQRQSNAYVYYADVSLMVFLRLFPLIACIGVGVCYVRKPLPFEAGGVKTLVPRKDVGMVVQTSLRLATATELAKGQMVQFELNKLTSDTLVKFAHAIRPTGRQMSLPVPVPESVAAPALPISDAAVSLQSALDQDLFGYGKPLVMGFDASGQPELRDWRNLKVMAIAGLQGSGKTLGTAFFVSSMVVNAGAEAVLIDPHRNHPEGLHHTMLPLIERGLVQSVNPFDVTSALNGLLTRINLRLTGKESSSRPLVIVIDELAKLTKVEAAFDAVMQLMEVATEETRKAGVMLCCSSPKWTARYFNHRADFRQNMNTKCLFRMNKQAAELLVDERSEQKLLREVTAPGQFLFLPEDKGGRILRTPYLTTESLTTLAGLATQPSLPLFDTPRRDAQQAIADLGHSMSLEDIWKASGLSNKMTLTTFQTKNRPSSSRQFTEDEEAAILGVHS